jgi:hypothetical protein
MPNRIIHQSFRTNPAISNLSAEAERLYTRLITVADDYGYFDGDPRVMLGLCLPLLMEKIRISHVRKWIKDLVKAGLIQLYEIDGRTYGRFPAWEDEQRVYGHKPKFPAPAGHTWECAQPVPPSTKPGRYYLRAVTRGESPRTAANVRSYPRSEDRDPRIKDQKRDT